MQADPVLEEGVKRTPLKRKGWMSRGTKRLQRGTRLRAVGRRGEERAEVWRRAKSAAVNRAGSACEKCGTYLWPTADIHHLQPRGRGGSDALFNLAVLCRKDHMAIHSHSCEDWEDWLASSEADAREIRARLDAML